MHGGEIMVEHREARENGSCRVLQGAVEKYIKWKGMTLIEVSLTEKCGCGSLPRHSSCFSSDLKRLGMTGRGNGIAFRLLACSQDEKLLPPLCCQWKWLLIAMNQSQLQSVVAVIGPCASLLIKRGDVDFFRSCLRIHTYGQQGHMLEI